MAKKLVLIATADYSTSFRRIAPGTDLRSLDSFGERNCPDGVDVTDPAIQRVLAWKQAEGCTVVSIGAYLPEVQEHDFSIPQALQVLSNGKVG